MTASAGDVPARIFMSYRRDETAYPAAWLFERLADRFGREQVFKDVDSIELGDDFVEVITTAVGSCDVLLALIGRQWLTITGQDGRPRLDDAADFVRLEIEAALARNVRLIPILVDGAQMPRADELPASLAKLARRQALELSPIRFGPDSDRLLKTLDHRIAEARLQAVQREQSRPKNAVSIFVSYAREDEGMSRNLSDHLGGLRIGGYIKEWCNAQLAPGQEWEPEIIRRLDQADIILLLVTSSFLGSEFIGSVELARALERHRRGEAIVIPVILKPADWQSAGLAGLQALPKDGKPVSTWSDHDGAYLDIAGGLRRVIAAWRANVEAFTDPPGVSAEGKTPTDAERIDEIIRIRLSTKHDGLDGVEPTAPPVIDLSKFGLASSATTLATTDPDNAAQFIADRNAPPNP